MAPCLFDESPKLRQQTCLEHLLGSLYTSVILDGVTIGKDEIDGSAIAWGELQPYKITAVLTRDVPWRDLLNMNMQLLVLPGVESLDIQAARISPYPITMRIDCPQIFCEELDRLGLFLSD